MQTTLERRTTVHPLTAALTERHGLVSVSTENVEAFSTRATHVVLFFGGDPVTYPETLDVAVVLPELIREFRQRFVAGVVESGSAETLQKRYGVMKLPALVLLRDGEYVGVIAGVRDWSVYLHEITRLLEAVPVPPPERFDNPFAGRNGLCG